MGKTWHGHAPDTVQWWYGVAQRHALFDHDKVQSWIF